MVKKSTQKGDGVPGASGTCLAPTEAERRPNPGSIHITDQLKKSTQKAGDGNRTHVSSLEG